MSSCNELCEFGMHLAQQTGAPPRLVMPLARRLRRLATTHQRRCVVACNGCHYCGGSGFVRPLRPTPFLPNPPASLTRACEETEPDARPCPTCSLETVEAAIKATCAELDALKYQERWPTEEGCSLFAPYFQHDPRGATVRLRLPSMGDRPASEGLPVPTSGRV